MKRIFLLILLTAMCFSSLAQDGPKTVTPQMRQKFMADIEKQIPGLKQKKSKDLSVAEVEFMVDTFRIERLYVKTMDTDYSTAGMADATGERTKAYDKLLNKYYGKLMGLLKPEDKKALTDTQRSWITFRDNESKLIETLSKEVYSGGGTKEVIATASQYSELVSKRAIQIAEYYLTIVSEYK